MYNRREPQPAISRFLREDFPYGFGAVNVTVQFFSYFKDLTGVTQVEREVAPGTTLGALHDTLCGEYSALREMCRSTLLAVGVDYQPRDYVLLDGDIVSLFPPVQGG